MNKLEEVDCIKKELEQIIDDKCKEIIKLFPDATDVGIRIETPVHSIDIDCGRLTIVKTKVIVTIEI